MIKLTKYLLLTFMLLGSFNELVVAQNGGFAGASSRIGYGPRAMSMANAYTATTSEGIYPYYNPAFSAEVTGFKQFDLGASSMSFDRIFQTVGANFKLPPNAGISVGIIRTGVKNIDERSFSGYPLGEFDISEYQLFAAFGINFSSKFNAGISFKLNRADYHEELSATNAIGVDLGFLYKINQNLNFAFVIQDMFANYTWNSNDLYGLEQGRNVVNTFPTRFKWALAYQRSKFTIATEFELQSYISEVTVTDIFVDGGTNTQILESTEEVATSSGIFRVGGSWKAHERFTLRGGYKITDTTNGESGSLSTGFSIHLPFDALSPSIDYAFVIEPYNVANMHVFALRLHL